VRVADTILASTLLFLSRRIKFHLRGGSRMPAGFPDFLMQVVIHFHFLSYSHLTVLGLEWCLVAEFLAEQLVVQWERQPYLRQSK